MRDELDNVYYPKAFANEEMISELSSARNSTRAKDVKKVRYKSLNESVAKSPIKQSLC